jgi:hypothetical protein
LNDTHKLAFISNKESDLRRAILAKILQKTTNEWKNENLIQEIKNN